MVASRFRWSPNGTLDWLQSISDEMAGGNKQSPRAEAEDAILYDVVISTLWSRHRDKPDAYYHRNRELLWNCVGFEINDRQSW